MLQATINTMYIHYNISLGYSPGTKTVPEYNTWSRQRCGLCSNYFLVYVQVMDLFIPIVRAIGQEPDEGYILELIKKSLVYANCSLPWQWDIRYTTYTYHVYAL